jgi:hypothetical protein
MGCAVRTLSAAFLAPGRLARDKRAGAMTQLDHAIVFELPVRLGDRVRVDHQLLRQRPDARQLVARPQRSGFDGVLHLLHQLEVDGHAERRVWAENHRCTTVTVLLN